MYGHHMLARASTTYVELSRPPKSYSMASLGHIYYMPRQQHQGEVGHSISRDRRGGYQGGGASRRARGATGAAGGRGCPVSRNIWYRRSSYRRGISHHHAVGAMFTHIAKLVFLVMKGSRDKCEAPPSHIADNHAGRSTDLCSSHIPQETPDWVSSNTSREPILAML
jgi:hypothetical protein